MEEIKRNTISLRVFQMVLLLSLVATVACFFGRDFVYSLAGGSAPPDPSSAESLGVTSLPFWTYKFLYQGPIPYSIACIFGACLAYGLTLFLAEPSPVRNDRQIQQFLAKYESTSGKDRSFAKLLQELPKAGAFANRMEQLLPVYQTTGIRQETLEANDRTSASDEADTIYRLQPLLYGEWTLPIAGFIGTVWGVTGAVNGLRQGITTLFGAGELTQEVLASFLDGFRGLVLAFDTTLAGLVGLAVVGTLRFLLKRRAMHVLGALERASNRVLQALPETRLEDLIREGFFVTNEDGDLERNDDGKPIPLDAEWRRLVLAGLLQVDDKGDAIRDENKRPTPIAAEWREEIRRGFFETDDENRVVLTEDGKPVPRWQRFTDLVLREFFEMDDHDQLVPYPDNGGPISKAEHWRQHMTSMITQHLYEVTSEEAKAIAEGKLVRTGERVALQSRSERRFQHIASDLDLMIQLLDSLRPRPSNQENGKQLPGRLILPPSGTPVRALTINRSRFAVSREKVENLSDFRLITGIIEEKLHGTVAQPILGPETPLPEEINALTIGSERIAYSFPLSNSIETQGWESPSAPDPACVLDGQGIIVPRSLMLLQFEGCVQVLFAVQREESSFLMAWKADGSSPAPEEIAALGGPTTAICTHDGLGWACATAQNGGAQITSVTPSQPVSQWDVKAGITALTFDPTGRLWFANSLKEVGVLGSQDGAKKTELRFRYPESIDLMAVTRAGDVILAENSGKRIVVVGESQDHQPLALDYPSTIEGLATTQQGHLLLVGLGDGSVWALNTAKRLGAPLETTNVAGNSR